MFYKYVFFGWPRPFFERNSYNYETVVNFWPHIISKMCFTTCKQKAKNANKFSTQGQKCTILEFLSQKMVLVTLYLEKMWKLIFCTSKLFLFKFGNSKNKTFLLLPHIKRLWQSKPLYNKPFNYWINCRMNAFLWDYTLKMDIFEQVI